MQSPRRAELSPEETERRRAEIEFRSNISEGPRQRSWLNIAGPVGAVLLIAFLVAFCVAPMGVIRSMQRLQLAWSGVTQSQASLKDGTMTYYVASGPPGLPKHPLLLIHGLGPDSALVWRRVMAPIAAKGRYVVIAPNLMGFGSSAHDAQTNCTIAYQAGAIGQLIDQLKLRHVSIVGWDLGADVALYYAVDHPRVVNRLILVSGGLFGRSAAKTLSQGMLPGSVEQMHQQVAQSFFDLPPMPSFIYRRMMDSLAADLPSQTGMMNSIPRAEAHIRARVGRIFNILTVVAWGGKDPYFGLRQGERLHAALPGSATIVFKSSGHYPQLGHPKDFANTILFILKQTDEAR